MAPWYRVIRSGAVVGLVLLASLLRPASATVQEPATDDWAEPTVTVAVLRAEPPAGAGSGDEPRDEVLRAFEGLGVAVGLASTSQGDYSQVQAFLDISQGTRQPRSLYGSDPPSLSLQRIGDRWLLPQWSSAVERARRASVTIQPGALASAVPGGGAFVGEASSSPAAVVAADRTGVVADASVAAAPDVVPLALAARERHSLVVVAVPDGQRGIDVIRSLVRARRASDLVIAIHLPSTSGDDRDDAPPSRFFKQTAIAIAGMPEGSRGITSRSTRQDGLVSVIDVAPTVLRHLRVPVPPQMRGHPVRSVPDVDAAHLERLRRRWHDVRSGRQEGSLGVVLLGASLSFLGLSAVMGARRAAAPSLRLGSLALLWWPTAALAVAPFGIRASGVEAVTIAACSLACGLLNDRLVRWPHAPIAPAVTAIAVMTVDLATGGRLLTQSVLSPSIASGNRFYGISNELEPLLPALLLVGIAATGWTSVRRIRWTYAAAGIFLAGVVGAGRLGADVGGVMTVSAAMLAASFTLQPKPPNIRTLALAVVVPVAALALLIAVDLTFGGGGHLANNLSRATNTRELWELVARRYELSFHALQEWAVAIPAVVSCAAIALGVRYRRRLFGEFPTPGWAAALAGGLAGGVAGALTNDSGPVLLTNAVGAVAAVAGYLAAGGTPSRGGAATATPGSEPR